MTDDDRPLPERPSLRRRLGPLLAMLAIFAFTGLTVFGGEFFQRPEDNDAPSIDLVDIRGGDPPPPMRGQLPTVVHFWSTDCNGCDNDLADIAALTTQWQGKVQLLAIGSGSRDAVRSRAEGVGEGVWVARDTTDKLRESFGLGRVPATAFITPDGRVLSRQQGLISTDTLDRRVRALIAKTTSE